MQSQDISIKIKESIASEMQAFDQRFDEILRTRLPLAESVIRYFLARSGKRLRPMVTMLAARLFGPVTPATINGAAALELLHNATLMHDDVVDQSMQRRGADTINKVWDNRVAVLMGDFFMSKCLSCSNATGSLQISCILADMVSELVEGELEQIANIRSSQLSEEAYFSVIRGKTASLFVACMRVGALSVGASAQDEARLAHVGELMGLIFQIRDDIFDYYPSTEKIGKPTGHDILEGKITLPLLYALQHGPADEVKRMRGLIDQPNGPSEDDVQLLVEFAKNVGGIEYAQAKMKKLAFEARKELEMFENNNSRSALMDLIEYFASRTH